MNVLDAAHRIGLEYPGGITALAERMKIRPAVFRGKLAPNNEVNHLYLSEAMLMQAVTGRHDILHAMAEELHHVCIPLPDFTDEDVSHAIATTCAEFGDYLRRIDDALQDHKVTPNEVKRLEKELTELVGAASRLQAIMAAKAKR